MRIPYKNDKRINIIYHTSYIWGSHSHYYAIHLKRMNKKNANYLVLVTYAGVYYMQLVLKVTVMMLCHWREVIWGLKVTMHHI